MLLAALLVAFQEVDPAPVACKARGWDDFPVFVWREKYAGQPLPEELAEPFGGVILMRDEDSGWARERGLSYLVWNVAGRDALHLDADENWNRRVENWIETRDENLLVREPCLNDPRTEKELFATLERTIAKHGKEPGLGFVLGDEVGLTPNGDPFDYCRCAFCEAKWGDHAKANGIPESSPLTDEVRLALMEDDFSLLGAWLERRRFDQALLLGLLERIAALARGDRERLVGLLGLRGRTAFGGVDVLAIKRFADFVEGYSCADTRALVASDHPGGRLSHRLRLSFPGYDAAVSTLFLRDESPAGAAWLAWEAWMRGADALVLWSDRDLEQDRERTARLAGAIRSIRDLRARFPNLAHPGPTPVVLLHDGDSLALSWLRDALLDGPTWPRRRTGLQEEHGTRERALRHWLDAADRTGIPLGGTTLATLDPADAPCLVAVQLLALGKDDVDRLEAFLDAGGTLLIDGPLAWVNREGVPWTGDIAQRLHQRAPGRVRIVTGETERIEALQDLPWSGSVSLATSDGLIPWWVTQRSTEFLACGFSQPPGLVCALPIARSPRERIALGALAVQAETVGEIEWLQPRPGESLAPGDPVLFLLRTPSGGRTAEGR